MRLTTWNCNGAFHRKMGAVMSLKPDILIVPECGDTATAQRELGVTAPTSTEWVGRIPNKGLGVFSFGNYTISRPAFYNPDHRFILPLEVKGPTSFLLLAVWTLPGDKGSYVKPLVDAWEEYKPQFAGRDFVIAGDFNANAALPGKPGYHFSRFIGLAESSGVRSLYHEATGEHHGEEKLPTFFLQRKKEKSMHIDFIFAGSGLISRLESVDVGRNEQWLSHSDHMPMTAVFSDMIVA